MPPAPRETNIFATLSVVFAFIFAPAGAVFGHLGLHQIKRTPQPGRSRAILGLALSYVMIVVIVVALTLWLVLRDDSSSRSVASDSSGTSVTSTTATTPAGPPPPPCGTGVAAPPLNQGRTVSDSELTELLLTPEEVRVSQDNNLQKLLRNLKAESPRTEFLTSPYPIGTVEPAGCANMVMAGTFDDYRDTGYQSTYLTTMTQDDPDGSASFTQVVTLYPDAEAAHRAITAIAGKLADPDGHTSFTLHTSDGGTEPYLSNLSNSYILNDSIDYLEIISIPVGFSSSNPGAWHSPDRFLAQTGNALIDVSSIGFGSLTDTNPFGIVFALAARLK